MRSTQQLDLKDMADKQSTFSIQHLALVGISICTGALIYTLVTSTFASTSESASSDKSKITEAIIVDNSHVEKELNTANETNTIADEILRSVTHSDNQQDADLTDDDLIALLHSNEDKPHTVTQPTSSIATTVQPDENWVTATVKKKDTLSTIFKRNQLEVMTAYRIADLEDAKPLLKIRPGETLDLLINEDGELAQLNYKLDHFNTLITKIDQDEFQTQIETRTPSTHINRASATIWNSLAESAGSAGISIETVYELTTLFGWQIDFAKDIQPGDKFSVIHEELFLDGEKVDNGPIIAAELVSSNKTYRAVRHIDDEGRTTYYAPNGEGIQGTFLRTPMKLGRVTSKFTNRRFHPIKKEWRAHKGVDYGAPTGTPVLATGDGVVEFKGNKSGYGKTLILRHGGKYTTLYAHLNGYRDGLKTGGRVYQGETIGYVGSTGWATGPHLHYEFRINSVHKNPLTVELPRSESIDESEKDEFMQFAKIWEHQLNQLSDTEVASKDDERQIQEL